MTARKLKNLYREYENELKSSKRCYWFYIKKRAKTRRGLLINNQLTSNIPIFRICSS